MNEAHVTVDTLICAAESKQASLVPETAGYLVLCIALAAGRMPVLFDESNIFLSLDGDVSLGPRCEMASSLVGARLLRTLLARLLSVSSGAHSGLMAVAHGHGEHELSIAELAATIETALIPMNRAAARRALARLARESLKAVSAGLHGHPHALHSEPVPARFSLRPPSPGERRLEGMRSTLPRSLWGTSFNSIQYSESSIEMPKLRAPVILTPLPSCVLTPAPRAPAIPRPLNPPAIKMRHPFDENEACEPNGAVPEPTPSPKDENLPFWKEASVQAGEEPPLEAKKGCTLRFFAPRSTDGERESSSIAGVEAPVGEGSLVTFLDFSPIESGAAIEGTPTVVMGDMVFEAEPPYLLDGDYEPVEVHITLPWPAKYPYSDQEGRASVIPALAFETHCLEFTAPQPTYTAETAELISAAAAEPDETSAPDADDADNAGDGEEDAETLSMLSSAAPPAEIKDITIELDLQDCELLSEATPAPAPAPAPVPAGPDRADELLRAFVAGKEGETHLRATAKDLRAFAGIDLTPSMAVLPIGAAEKRKDEFSMPLPTALSADDITPPGASEGTAITRRASPAKLFSSALARDVFAFAIGLLGAMGLLYLRPSLADDVISLVTQALPVRKSTPPDTEQKSLPDPQPGVPAP